MIIGSMEDIVTRLDMRVNTLELRLKLLEHQPELQPEPQPDLDATIRSLHESNEGLRNLLADAKRTERDLDAEVARLTKENQRLTQLAWEAQAQVDKLKQHNDDLARDAGSLIGARALNEALTQKQHMLEAKNRDLEERLERHRDCIDRTADALELLGFQVFPPGTDICDND